jgi:DNA-binding Lrp family transcriptional regulator
MSTNPPARLNRDEFDVVDREVMNILQSDFPLVREPFSDIGKQCGVSEAECIDRVLALKHKNVVRQIGAIFDTRRLGYSSTLVAMRFPEEYLDRGAQILNAHPGISHNYARNGEFNLWFTLALPPGKKLSAEVEKLTRLCGAETARILPTIRFFKIGVNFDMVNRVSNAKSYFVPDAQFTNGSQNGDASSNVPTAAKDLTDFDIEFVREFQEDLPLASRPFDGMADRLGLAVTELFAKADEMIARRLMRRYAAVLHHRRAGFSANAMAVWNVPEDQSVAVGQAMAKHPAVTHCYERPRHEDWRFSHFTMIHAVTRQECEIIAEDIAAETDLDDYQLLYSHREYKKTRVRYFVDDNVDVERAAAAVR